MPIHFLLPQPTPSVAQVLLTAPMFPRYEAFDCSRAVALIGFLGLLSNFQVKHVPHPEFLLELLLLLVVVIVIVGGGGDCYCCWWW